VSDRDYGDRPACAACRASVGHDMVDAPTSIQCMMVDGVGLLACRCNRLCAAPACGVLQWMWYQKYVIKLLLQ